MRIRIDSLDKLFSEYIRRLANGICQRCGVSYPSWKNLQCCHFHGRSTKSVRWDEDNAVGLCFGCHQYMDGHPMEKVEWFKQHIGEDKFDLLNSRLRNTFPRPDKKLLTLYYKQKIEEME